ncbi:tRNA glutamyl-Q(34) synthetase GluQRS [Oecophyllibacter saccharovorans]|uniref:tRNA glutamyl-Q(34) synthetase GluQRS n=1 Tax=Oecophyllibacter saccharovorans TaxID=2558360 RepID=UPI0011713472|nr:tRNA glutamyl-Q(34) synthetase GluQRS [Oecophyllibacter saccharovorans]TPW34781.1 tRNA glutamyl-Q(34) synthetase GluQRS [Oecophyllibacter saccharovorans]
MPLTTRFAPSPTGRLHLGHVVSALYGRALAGSDGRFLLRVEDTDRIRCRPAYGAALLEDLGWLGLRPAGSVRVQSAHLSQYEAVLRNLQARHLLYPCSCTRREISARSTVTAPDGSRVYSGTCRNRNSHPPGRPLAWRLNMQAALEEIRGEPEWQEIGRLAGPGRQRGQAAAFGDIVLGRRDSGVAYHLCVTHDDALQGVSCVTRGMDLLHATSVQRVLQVLMGWPAPVYAHHALLLDAEGRKLSKREGAEGIFQLRQGGWSAHEVLAHPLVRQTLESSLP